MKKEYIVLALIIVALSAYLVFHKSDSTHYTLPVLDDLGSADISRIDLVHGTTTLTLEKTGDQWVVGEEKFPANESQITSMIKAIKELKLTALISESKNYNRYELDDENKIRVSASSKDKVIRTFDVGKTASSYKHTFVKLDTDPRVYHAENNLKSTFNKTEDNLTEKLVMNFNPETVYGIQTKDNGKEMALARKQEPVTVDVTKEEKKDQANPETQAPAPKDIWTDASGKEKDNTKITAFVSLFSNLKCDHYIKGQTKESLTGPIFEVTINTDKVCTLSIFPKKDEDKTYPAISSENAFPFTLSEAKVDDIKKKLGEI